jgi:hypothetical protein
MQRGGGLDDGIIKVSQDGMVSLSSAFLLCL